MVSMFVFSAVDLVFDPKSCLLEVERCTAYLPADCCFSELACCKCTLVYMYLSDLIINLFFI